MLNGGKNVSTSITRVSSTSASSSDYSQTTVRVRPRLTISQTTVRVRPRVIFFHCTMARPHPVRALTGCVRRKAKRDSADYSRSMQLSHRMVGLRSQIQRGMATTFHAAEAAYDTIVPLVAIIMLLAHYGHNPQALVIVNMLQIEMERYIFNNGLFEAFFRLDHELFDITPEELANKRTMRLARQFHRIEDWTEEECYQFTGFQQGQLHEIYLHFGLEEVADAEPHIGYIAVPSGSQGKYHLFPPQEIFLFFMTRMRTGDSKKKLCMTIFGGHASRWSPGLNWIMRFLDQRYERTISHRKLEDYVDDFPRYYNAISSFMEKDAVKFFPDGNSVDKMGLNFCPLPIFGFIDCSIDKISRPFSGPDGDYAGAPRKLNENIYQRSVYTGYKKFHGIKVETVMLANGIMTIFGPVSARIHDVGGVLRMSQLDNFLSQIQQGKHFSYLAFGDGAYNAHDLNCKSILCHQFYLQLRRSHFYSFY